MTFLRQPDQFWPGWGTLGLLVVVVCVCFFLRQRYYLAAWLFSSALFAGATTAIPAAGSLDYSAFLYVPVVLLAGALLGPFACLVFASGATVTLLLVPADQAAASTHGVLAAAIPLLWLAGLVAWASSRNLLTALHWARSTSRLAEQHLREARASQAQLAAEKRQLEDANYRLGRVNVPLNQLLRAFSGEQAMEHLRAQAVDVVLLDLLMPEMDGFAVLDLMRREPALARIPVIAVSAKGAFDPLASSTERTLTLVSDQPFAVGEPLRIVQITLDALPPAPATTAELPAAAPGGSGAFG